MTKPEDEEVKIVKFEDPRLTPKAGLVPVFGALALCIGFVVYGIWFKDPPAPKFPAPPAAASAATATPNLPTAAFGGIGIGVNPSPQGHIVARVFPGTPAERAGLQKGDVILSVDGLSVIGLDLATVTGRLRGPEGSSVSLTYSRNGGAPQQLTLKRELLQPEVFQGKGGK